MEYRGREKIRWRWNHTKAYYRVIFGDTDAMKIVYNANYLRFFEIGRNEFLRELGFPLRGAEREI